MTSLTLNRSALLMVGLLATLGGCAGSGSGGDDAGSGEMGDGDGDGDEDILGDVYVDGIEKAGATYQVAIMTADPSPPDRGLNTWTLHIGSDGADVDNATVTVSPWMPAHGHGTTPADYAATGMSAPGMYEVGPFDLFMPGLWELTISVQGDNDDTADEVTFSFDLEG